MSPSDIERWENDLNAYMEVTKSTEIEDATSLRDAATKKIVWVKVLAKDAYNLKAIDDWYLYAINEAIQTMDNDLNFFQKMATKYTSERLKPLFKTLFEREMCIITICLNDHVMMLVSVVSKKLAEEKEIIKQGEKLKEILKEQDKASKERIKTYVV